MLKRSFIILLLVSTAAVFSATTYAQGPRAKDFGFGIIVGDPFGLTTKVWLNKENAFVLDIGASYFGSPRIQLDYIWHIDAFNSDVVQLYAGPGLGLGIGGHSGFLYKEDDNQWYSHENTAVAARCILGVNVTPKNSSFEVFLELGPNIGLAPHLGTAVDAGVGVRFYP